MQSFKSAARKHDFDAAERARFLESVARHTAGATVLPAPVVPDSERLYAPWAASVRHIVSRAVRSGEVAVLRHLVRDVGTSRELLAPFRNEMSASFFLHVRARAPRRGARL